jgi:molybdopterin synthase sulfur carrier subunit
MAKLLYFAALADRLGRTAEEVELPAGITDVRALLAWLRSRGGVWESLLAENAVQVTVNRQFASLDTGIDDRLEIAIVPTGRR